MKISDLTHSDVEIEFYRNKDQGCSMVTVLITKDKVNIEAYDNCKLDINEEIKTQNRILKVLGFTDKFIEFYNAY